MQRHGSITAIYVAPEKRADCVSVDAVQLMQGKGIVGDRYFGQRQNHPEKNITLIEAEAIEHFNTYHQLDISPGDFRRNLVTRNIRLNDLVGQTFSISSVLLRGIELCEPCSILGGKFSTESLSSTQVISALLNKGGLRAEILSSGVVRVGDAIASANT
jgi:MOSC domain-containing protein YiiM